ncbi:hypothetical protein CP082626L3_0350B, partial [Chlamydia psittaci 08-2626_L3]
DQKRSHEYASPQPLLRNFL